MDPLGPGWHDLDPADERPPCRPQRYVNLDAERVVFDGLHRVEALEAAIVRAWRRPRATAWTCAPRTLSEAVVRQCPHPSAALNFCGAQRTKPDHGLASPATLVVTLRTVRKCHEFMQHLQAPRSLSTVSWLLPLNRQRCFSTPTDVAS